MSNGDEAMWYYEAAGQPAGPIAESALRELLRSGELSPGARVWRAGMAGWQPARSAPGLEGAAAARHRLARVDLLFVVLLSLVTLGVYGAVKFYQAAKAYQALAPARASSFDTLFWSCVGLATAGMLASIPVAVLGGLLGLACAVVAVLTLGEALALREEALEARRLSLDLTSPTVHKVLFVFGALSSALGAISGAFAAGVALLAVQAILFFHDHNRMVEALARPAAPAPGAPAAAAPAPAPDAATVRAAFCTRCGELLAPQARFCGRCGAAVPPS